MSSVNCKRSKDFSNSYYDATLIQNITEYNTCSLNSLVKYINIVEI